MRRLAIILWLLPLLAGAEIIPSTNRIDWTLYAGIPGGIPHRTSVHAVLAAGSTYSQINSALAAAGSNEVVVLTNGNYTITGSIDIPAFVTLRGSGSNTVLTCSASILMEGAGTYASGWQTDIDVKSGYTRGSSNLVLASAPITVGVGCILWIHELNDEPWVSPHGYEVCNTPTTEAGMDAPWAGQRVRGQHICITGMTNGTNIAFWPPISYGFLTARDPQISYCSDMGGGDRNAIALSGLEDLTITNTTTSSLGSVFIEYAANCWVSNVNWHMSQGEWPAIRGFTAARIQIEHCTITGYSGQDSGIWPWVNCDGWLIQNNAFVRMFQSVLPEGRGGHHVIAYNFTQSATNVSTAQIAEFGQHGCHPQNVLVEGNVIWATLLDCIHGSSSQWTFLRNNLRGWQSWNTWVPICIGIDQTNYWNNFVGNVLGYTNIATNGWSFAYDNESAGGCSERPADTRVVWLFGYAGGNGQANDTDSKARTLRHGNYDFMRKSNAWDGAISDHDVPTSYFYASKPSWWGFLTWPPVDNNTPNYSSSMTNLPAGYRWTFGTNPPAAPDTTLDASYFGFDTNNADNYNAMVSLQTYANTNHSVDVNFSTNGRYKVILPWSSGTYRAACWFTNVTNITITGNGAEFYCTNQNADTWAMFRFTQCTNMNVQARFTGKRSGVEDGVCAISLWSSNTIGVFSICTTQCFDGVRIGFEGENAEGFPKWSGNNHLTITATNEDTCYGVVAYRASDLTITNYSVGTATNQGSDRAVYLAGCKDSVARSWSKNLAVHDCVNLCTTSSSYDPPIQRGCSNITWYCTDLGSTNNVSSQFIAGLGTVSVAPTNETQHADISFNLSVTSTPSIWYDTRLFCLQSVQTPRVHSFSNITITGTWDRSTSTNSRIAIDADWGDSTSLAYFKMALTNFHDLGGTSTNTLYIHSTEIAADITAQNSTYGVVNLANGTIQHFTNLDTAPAAPRNLRATTVRVGTIRGR